MAHDPGTPCFSLEAPAGGPGTLGYILQWHSLQLNYQKHIFYPTRLIPHQQGQVIEVQRRLLLHFD